MCESLAASQRLSFLCTPLLRLLCESMCTPLSAFGQYRFVSENGFNRQFVRGASTDFLCRQVLTSKQGGSHICETRRVAGFRFVSDLRVRFPLLSLLLDVLQHLVSRRVVLYSRLPHRASLIPSNRRSAAVCANGYPFLLPPLGASSRRRWRKEAVCDGSASSYMLWA